MFAINKARFPLAAAVIAVTLIAPATTMAEESESHLAAARAAIKAIGATNQFDPILPQAAQALRLELVRKDPNLQAEINAVVDEKALALAGRRADLEAEAARAYARAFSEAELQAIADFYNTDAGKKLISEGPIVTRELLRAANVWQTGLARDLAQSVAQELEIITSSQNDGAATDAAAGGDNN